MSRTTVNQIFMLIGLRTTARRKTREDNKSKTGWNGWKRRYSCPWPVKLAHFSFPWSERVFSRTHRVVLSWSQNPLLLQGICWSRGEPVIHLVVIMFPTSFTFRTRTWGIFIKLNCCWPFLRGRGVEERPRSLSIIRLCELQTLFWWSTFSKKEEKYALGFTMIAV